MAAASWDYVACANVRPQAECRSRLPPISTQWLGAMGVTGRALLYQDVGLLFVKRS